MLSKVMSNRLKLARSKLSFQLVSLFFLACILAQPLPLIHLPHDWLAWAENEVTDFQIPLDEEVADIAVSSATNKIYVLTDTSLVIIDGDSNSIISKIALGFYSVDLLIDESMNTAFVTTKVTANRSGYSADHHISIIDIKDNKLVDSITIPGGHDTFPFLDAVNPHSNTLYFYNGSSPTLYLLDEGTGAISSLDKLKTASMIRVDPDGNFLYIVQDDRHGPIRVFAANGSDFERISNTLELSQSPAVSFIEDMAFNSETNKLYVAVLNVATAATGGEPIPSSSLYVINASSFSSLAVVATLEMYRPSDIEIDTERNIVYVSDYTQFIDVIDGNSDTITKKIENTPRPDDIAVNPITGVLYASQYQAPMLHVYDKRRTEVALTSEFSGTEYNINGIATNVQATSFSINAGKSIQIQASAIGDKGGILSLNLPRILIDGITEVDAATKSGSTEKLQFEQTHTPTMTMLTMQIPPEVSTIELSGSHVVPEFPAALVALVLGMGVATFVAGSRRLLAKR